MVEAAQGLGAKFIHFSTEYVFDGTSTSGYSEDSATHPLNVYGESKLAGENYVINYVNGYVVRSSWLFGHAPQRGKPRGMNFVDTMLKLAAEKQEIRVVNDQFGKLTATRDLSHAVVRLLAGDYAPGVYHLVNEGVASWYDVAREVFRLKGVVTPLVHITSAEYPTTAKRPQNAVLLNTKFPPLRSWQEALRDYLA
jgi:dTDP-4-dehydrorhamnose reductase